MGCLIGLGTDIVEISRIKNAAGNWRERFVQRIFTPGEIEFCYCRNNPWPCLAARYAAKEAVFKALGTGITSWHEVEITGGGEQPVQVVLTGRAHKEACARGIDNILLTVSHNRDTAVAFAAATGKG